MGVEYIAWINEDDYETFKALMTTTLPADYEMWLRVRERGKLREFEQRGATFAEIEVSPEEFDAYCKGLKKPDFSIVSLDGCARAQARARKTSFPLRAIR
jgi:hypothetical protein